MRRVLLMAVIAWLASSPARALTTVTTNIFPAPPGNPSDGTVPGVKLAPIRQFATLIRFVTARNVLPVPPTITYFERAWRTDNSTWLYWTVTGHPDATGLGSGVSPAVLSDITLTLKLFTPVGQAQ